MAKKNSRLAAASADDASDPDDIPDVDAELLDLETEPSGARGGRDQPAGVAPGEDDTTPLDEEPEEVRLSLRQKLIVLATACASFFVFSFVFLPIDEIIRYQLRGLERQIKIEFGSLDLNLVGNDSVDGLRAHLPDGTVAFSADHIESELKWRHLLAWSPSGPVEFQNVEFHMPGLAFEAEVMHLRLALRDASRPLGTWDGSVQLAATGVHFSELPLSSLPIPINLDDLNVQKLDLNLQFSNGTLNFQDSVMVSDLLTARLSGSGRLGRTFGATVLDTRICITPAADLESKNPELFTIYIMGGGSAGGQLCVNLGGTISQPQAEMQSGGGFPGSDNTTAPDGGEPLPGTPGSTMGGSPGSSFSAPSSGSQQDDAGDDSADEGRDDSNDDSQDDSNDGSVDYEEP